MTDVQDADVAQVGRLAVIAATGFYDDPVMSWVFPDATTRLAGLTSGFTGLVHDYLPDRGVSHVVDDACVTFWRTPDFDYEAPSPAAATQGGPPPFADDVLERFTILEAMMQKAHPHDRAHWYLNVISTLPERQGQGLGTRLLAPVLQRCDAEGVPAYLESSNPRNMTLYRRHGFEQTGELPLPDGPSLYPMWRDPR